VGILHPSDMSDPLSEDIISTEDILDILLLMTVLWTVVTINNFKYCTVYTVLIQSTVYIV
jgi:DNA repair protein RadC